MNIKTVDQRLREGAIAKLKKEVEAWASSFYGGRMYSSDPVVERNTDIGSLLDALVKAKMDKCGPIVAQQAVDDFLADFEQLQARVSGIEDKEY